MDGSICLGEAEFDRFAPDFFRRSRRAVKFRGKVHLRGGRYLISGNPTFELRTKLSTFREDLDEGLESLPKIGNGLMQLAVADYIKNSAVTMLNSFVQEEKNGKYRFDSISYQSIRKGMLEFTYDCVSMFYSLLFSDEIRGGVFYRNIIGSLDKFYKAQESILDSYRGGVFSSRHITRPEATHPLIIASSVAYFSTFSRPPFPEIIIGMPAGSTELAFAHRLGQNIFAGNEPSLLLFPVSFHSAKDEFDETFSVEMALKRWVAHHQDKLKGRKILIADDNSSTGRTIQAACDSLGRAQPAEITVAVAEADLIRSEIDKDNLSRPLVASILTYVASVSVLPVSKTISPKTDLKEILELRKVETCTRLRYLQDRNSFSERVIGSVYVDAMRNPTERMLDEIDSGSMIRKFQKTPLSNFAPVEVELKQEKFNSVEHAYQSMKFLSTTWSKVSQGNIDYINRRLEGADDHVTRENLSNVFSRLSLSPGNSKRVANHLRRLGHVRDDWDHVKVPYMTDLLIQKYATSGFYEMLQSTNGMYLIEGNTWNDTFWGECDGRGRNFLGRILMELRKHSIEELRMAASEIRSRLL